MLASLALQIADSVPQQIETPEIVWSAIAPHLILMIGGVLLLTVVSLLRGKAPSWFPASWTVITAALAIVSLFPLWSRFQDEGSQTVMAGAIGLDGFSLFVAGIICVSVLMGALLLEGYVRREDLEGPEWYVLMLLSASGGLVMASANDLIVLFIGLEILSVAAYVLASMHSRRISSQEAGLKYLILGAFASAFLLYGIAMIYGATGSTNLIHIQTFLSEQVLLKNGLLLAGFAFMLVGLGFKVAAVPFHTWAPDVYQGSPSPVSGYMASGIKAAGFAALIRVFVLTFGPTYGGDWRPMVYVLAVLSLLVGAYMALIQTNVKRMLAYSSISHAGFIMVAVEASSNKGTSAALFYLLSYTFMVTGSFGVVMVMGRVGDGMHDLKDYKGLGRTRPGIALLFTVFLLAQAGVPFTAGFLSKFYVINAVADQGQYALAVVAMVSAVVAAYLYLRLVVAMYFDGNVDGEAPAELAGPAPRIPVGAALALGIAVIGTLWLGIIPGTATRVANDAVAELVAFQD
ncbi:MAG TPA: NADH-quinone oxidoreductase subunit N [Microthrixaceae bacterium]|nr:NADH-quinone oxidoreductase subunit N [Microthrixaceae bacterium]